MSAYALAGAIPAAILAGLWLLLTGSKRFNGATSTTSVRSLWILIVALAVLMSVLDAAFVSGTPLVLGSVVAILAVGLLTRVTTKRMTKRRETRAKHPA